MLLKVTGVCEEAIQSASHACYQPIYQ